MERIINTVSHKGLILNTSSTSIVKNWNIGDILFGLDERGISFIEREKEKRNLLRLQKILLI